MTTQSELTDVRCASGDGECASARCGACERAYCAGCIAVSGESPACRACAYDAALGGAVRRKQANAAAARAAGPALARLRRIRKVASWVVFLGSSAVLLSVGVPGTVEVLQEPDPFAYGPVDSDAPGITKAVEGLWRVRAAMDAYLGAHAGVAPAAFSELTDAPAACPGCGGSWNYTKGPGRKWTVACPTPGRHERGAVLLDEEIGPPQVRFAVSGDGR